MAGRAVTLLRASESKQIRRNPDRSDRICGGWFRRVPFQHGLL